MPYILPLSVNRRKEFSLCEAVTLKISPLGRLGPYQINPCCKPQHQTVSEETETHTGSIPVRGTILWWPVLVTLSLWHFLDPIAAQGIDTLLCLFCPNESVLLVIISSGVLQLRVEWYIFLLGKPKLILIYTLDRYSLQCIDYFLSATFKTWPQNLGVVYGLCHHAPFTFCRCFA